MMIKANELRIGNYLSTNRYGYDEFVVNQISEDQVWFKGKVPGFNLVGCYNCEDDSYSELKPIPITEEWLLKFGFKEYDDGEGIYFKRLPNSSDTTFSELHIFIEGIWQETSSNVLNIIDDSEIYYTPTSQCKYVHQLQNLYFALTGEELILK